MDTLKNDIETNDEKSIPVKAEYRNADTNIGHELMSIKPDSIKSLIHRKPNLIVPKKGLLDTGTRPDGSDFFQEAMELKVLNERAMSEIQSDHPEFWNELGGGDPMKVPPFPGLIDTINNLFCSDILSQYPTTEGDLEVRNMVLGYLKQEGFSTLLSTDNIIFTVSTTHAFNVLCSLVLRPYDAVLFEAPTYGLFTFSPERVGGITRFFPLKKSEKWAFNAERLAQTIDQINAELQQRYKNVIDYIPKVAMVYQSNPQNPIGRVLSEEDRGMLTDVLTVCHSKGVLFIDDLIYKDLSYEKDVLPTMGIEGFESDVITLIGVSKSYGLAGIRAGVMIADEIIIRGIRDILFQTIDSPSQLQSTILGEVFNNTYERKLKYELYFKPLLAEYRHRFNLLRTGICGIDTLDESDDKKIIYEDLKKYYNDSAKEKRWLDGTPYLKLADGCIPEGGFFALLDLSDLIGKTYNSTVLRCEEDIMMYFYKTMHIRYLAGAYMAWPSKDQCIARISFAVERKQLIFFIQCLQEAVYKLGDG